MGDSILRGGRWGVAVGLGAVLIFSACGSGGGGNNAKDKPVEGKAQVQGATETAPGTAVAIINFAFDPKDLSVPAGTKVTWTNKDDAPHNVQDLSELNTPISPDMAQGATFSITYPKPGTYTYGCGLHTYMTGTVKVT
jgi:plastocyanin